MRIAVCDDEEKFRDQAKSMIDKISGSLDIVVDTYSNGYKLLEVFDRNPYDVLFLDIEMPVMTGLQFLRKSNGWNNSG